MYAQLVTEKLGGCERRLNDLFDERYGLFARRLSDRERKALDLEIQWTRDYLSSIIYN